MTWPGETDIRRENREAIEAIQKADPLAGVERGDTVWWPMAVNPQGEVAAVLRECRLVRKMSGRVEVEWFPGWLEEGKSTRDLLDRGKVHATREDAIRSIVAEIDEHIAEIRAVRDEYAAMIEAEPEDKP